MLLDSLSVAIFSILFFLLYLAPDKRLFRRLQIAVIFLLAALYKLVVTPIEIGWVLLLAIAVSLMYRYGMLKTGLWWRLILVVVFSLFVSVVTTILYEEATVSLAINQLAIGVAAVFLTYYLFEDDFLKARRARDKLQEESEINRPFVAFGQHAAGVVHDLKNDVNLVTAYSTLLSMKAKEREYLTEEDAQRLSHYVDRIKGRIDLVRYASGGGNRESEHINVQRVCRAAMYIFEIRPEYRRVIRFRLFVEDDTLYVHGRRASLLSILENLIGNACEAMVGGEATSRPGPKQLTLAATGINGTVLISVSDTGPGIDACRECEEEDCLNCGAFRIGQTTKADGSGLGLFSVKSQVDQLGGRFRLKSPKGSGLVAQVSLPRSNPAAKPAVEHSRP
ncbi:MAG: sensor histidine kinase [Spirochaetaceae bacterium]